MAQWLSGGQLRCSFCAKSQNDVRKLIAGPKVYICDRCVELCNDILAEEREDQAREGAASEAEQPEESSLGPLPAGAADCALCGGATAAGFLVAVKDRGFLCFACLDAIREASEPASGH